MAFASWLLGLLDQRGIPVHDGVPSAALRAGLVVKLGRTPSPLPRHPKASGALTPPQLDSSTPDVVGEAFRLV